ncbi:hypothetical protein [Mesorhizobium sp. M3A.F.Ca.ET.201.01.1.1]|uniref:hypothetical protein n=1 Tax=Mesorhizobium sp. M3A.F.Ca.ET.201.01.1.1 TaxID=2563946 RepID=UPI00167589FE|nr:hypothetical protein [Mesorhizobium sp. M3A.F.Ca.ET.201.01.1.1]
MYEYAFFIKDALKKGEVQGCRFCLRQHGDVGGEAQHHDLAVLAVLARYKKQQTNA